MENVTFIRLLWLSLQVIPQSHIIRLCGVCDCDYISVTGDEIAENIIGGINEFAATNPNLKAIDMDKMPTNDNVVNAIASAFPQLTSFSATNGVFGENISDAALDALRLSHPGITITISENNSN